MSVPHLLVILSVIITTYGSYRYIIDTLRGRTKPNRVTWLFWSLAPLIGVGASLDGGADPWSMIVVLTSGLVPLLVLVSSFVNKNSYWEITKFDISCGFISLISIIFWLLLGKNEIAVLFAILADLAAATPTILKAWKYPETESVEIFLTSVITGLMVVPSITAFTIIDSSFQVYLILVNLVLTFAILRKKLIH